MGGFFRNRMPERHLPFLKRGMSCLLYTSFSVEIPYGAKDTEGSWEFVKFITSKESQIYWASEVYDTVANIEASQDPSLMDIPVFKMALEAMPTTVVTQDLSLIHI